MHPKKERPKFSKFLLIIFIKISKKEVAQRLVAQICTKEYGRLTVVVGAYLNVEYCFSIPPTVFVHYPFIVMRR